MQRRLVPVETNTWIVCLYRCLRKVVEDVMRGRASLAV